MKKLFNVCLIGLAGALISWGFKGHRVIATIAQKHLTSNSAYIVSAYLQGESMADVATWADENKNATTAPWHFINLPLGLNHEQFVKAVQQGDNNVYTAILKAEATLKDKTISSAQKKEALEYLIHLVGDAHQPMHVSRKEDKGGNTIQVRFDNKGTNLHSLWDSKLIDHEGLNEADIAKAYDKATPAEIKQWQADSPVEWIWESYQISSELYANTKPGQEIDGAYYQKYIVVTRKRINQAAIRLSGELNKLFNNATISVISAATETTAAKAVAMPVKLEEVKNAVGKTITTQGKVYSSRDIGSMILVNLGAAYPDQLLTIALKGKAKELGALLENKTISVEGEVIDYKGKPEIIVTDPQKIRY